MNKETANFSINPDTKVGALLDKFPELQTVLIQIAPAFEKLQNPILRKTVAKVASLRQIAQVGNVPLSKLISKLRKAAGVEDIETPVDESESIVTEVPAWFDPAKIVKSFDARTLIDAGENPLLQVMPLIQALKKGEILELVTPFVPAPMIDLMRQKGYQIYKQKFDSGLVKTFFTLT